MPLLALLTGANGTTPLYKAEAGPHETEVLELEWEDAARSRTVKARAYVPTSPGGPFPAIVFSHGLWANRYSYGYFARHLASHGYVVVVPQHAGSDAKALLCVTCDVALFSDWILQHPPAGRSVTPVDRELFESSIADPDNLVNRPLDVSLAIDQLSLDPALSGAADALRVGVAGHSFGAYTSMAVGGMLVDLPPDRGGLDQSFRDSRVRASLAMSPQGPGTVGISDGAWSRYAVPSMFLTGSLDYGVGDAAETWRRSAFDQISGPDSYLLTLFGAGHAAFAQRAEIADGLRQTAGAGRLFDALLEPVGLGSPHDHTHLELIKAASTSFFDAYLKDDPVARAWLERYFSASNAKARAEFKPGTD